MASLALVTVSGQSFAQTLTTLGSFDGMNGQYPVGSLTLSSDGKTLYGVTFGGGANGEGSVFSIWDRSRV